MELRETGRAAMSSSSIAICGLARDCADSLEALIPQLERLGEAFAEYRIIVVENDSHDRTGSVLLNWCVQNSQVRPIQYCYLDTAEDRKPAESDSGAWFGQKRMERMAFARNRYLNALTDEPFPDFVAVVDLDIRSFSLPGIEHSFGLLSAWDVVTANGRRFSARNPMRVSVYWDSYAYEPETGFPGDVQTQLQIRQDQVKVADMLNDGKLLPARSAFGGLAIYRAHLLRRHFYSVMTNDCPDVPVLCDHPTLHRSIRRQNERLRLVINPHMTVNYGSALQLAGQAWKRLTA